MVLHNPHHGMRLWHNWHSQSNAQSTSDTRFHSVALEQSYYFQTVRHANQRTNSNFTSYSSTNWNAIHNTYCGIFEQS